MTEPTAAPSLHRTQFDAQLLSASATHAPLTARNHGRQILALDDGTVVTALAWGGDQPVLRIWKNRELAADHPLPAAPSAPCLVGGSPGEIGLWISAGDQVLHAAALGDPPTAVAELTGVVEDAAIDSKGRTAVVMRDQGKLYLGLRKGDTYVRRLLDDEAGHASIEFDANDSLHLVHGKGMGIEYRVYPLGLSLSDFSVTRHERIAEAYGSHPVLLVLGDRILVAYLGESCRKPSYKHWSPAWERLGHGGYVAALVHDQGRWLRFCLADSQQIVKPLRPTDGAYTGGPEVGLRTRIEEFGPPSLVLGPDGVPQVLWANLDRRWIYAARWLGESFSPAIEVRGPLEQLTGPCLTPKRVGPPHGPIPLGMVTRPRTYLDELKLPARAVAEGRRIDFVQADELYSAHGLVEGINPMTRHPGNPVIRVGEPGQPDDGAIVADIHRDHNGWRADVHYRPKPAPEGGTPAKNEMNWNGRAVSTDGIHWKKIDPVPADAQYQVVGESDRRYNIRFLEDPDEPDPDRRYKGFWRAPYGGPWAWLAVTSPDAKTWTKVADNTTVLNADDDLQLWIDPDDEPARRFKAGAISRSFCGRVCAQWSSPDGLHWNDERETLDFQDPFGAKPDRGTTGRILLDSWAGPDDEDELHGGYVFRDGDRWLLHYMKWTADGHIYCGLASSRDGINFSRVAGGRPTLPLGEPGTWDAGRVALREAPFRVGDNWRQYYAGCGWKHGLAGVGAKTSPWASLHSPMQTGFAEITAGRWAHLQLARESDEGLLSTVPIQLAAPHDLTVDVKGLGRPGHALACRIVDAATDQPVAGFDFADCDPIIRDGRKAPVTWSGKGMATLSPILLRIEVQLTGQGLRLFGLNLKRNDQGK